MNVLVGCEFSGVVRQAFRDRGHDAWSCDLLDPLDGSPHHFKCDVFKAIRKRKWDLAIFHPPCTYLCNSGVRWLHTEPGRKQKMVDGALFFRRLLDADIPMICVENPIPHRYAAELIGEGYTQTIQPWQFGHGQTKRTCLWLKGLKPLKPTRIVQGRDPVCHHMSPGKDRGLMRSITLPGIAKAMAKQWGG